MGAEHAPETVWKAQESYCVERFSFGATAKRLGIAESTVRRWADKFHWREEREAIAAAESEIRANTVKGRAFVLRKLLTSENGKEISQVAFAVASLERLALAATKAVRKQEEECRTPDFWRDDAGAEGGLALPDDISDAERVVLLEQAVNKQIAHVLTIPVPDMAKRVRDIKTALDVLAALKGKDSGGSIQVRFADEEEAAS